MFQDPEALTPLRLQLGVLLLEDLLGTRRRDRLILVDFFDLEAGLVFVQMLTRQSGLAVVRPDERLTARGVIQGIVALNVIAQSSEVGTPGKLMERDLVTDPPISYR